jgi:hypothetical protein
VIYIVHRKMIEMIHDALEEGVPGEYLLNYEESKGWEREDESGNRDGGVISTLYHTFDLALV